jgi:hypothetical protein
MIKQGQIVRADDGGLIANGRSYSPIKTTRKGKAVVPDISVVRALISEAERPSVGIAALKSDTTPKALPPVKERSTLVITRNWTAQGVVDNLSVMQARALYDLLKQIFGG